MPFPRGYFDRTFQERVAIRSRQPLERREISFDVANDPSYFAGMASNFTDRGINLNQGQRASAVVDRCVAMIASSCAALDLHVSTLDGTRRENDPVDLLFNRTPNPVMSARVFKETLFRRLEYRGQAFCYVDRGTTGEGEPQAIWPLYWPVDVVIDDVTVPQAPTIVGYRVNTARKTVPLLASETLWLRYPDGEQTFGCKAPLYSASFAQELDAYARAWQLGEYQNGARPSGVMRLGSMSEPDQERIRATYQGEIGGPGNAAKMAFVFDDSGQMGFDRLSLTPAEMSYIASRQVNADEMALAFGVPRDLLFGNSTFANQAAAKVALWSETNIPKLEVVAGEVDRQVIPDANLSAGFDISGVEAMQEHQNALVKRVAIEVGRDLKTIDEGRADLGLPPLPNGMGASTISVYRAKFAAVSSTDPSANQGEPTDKALMAQVLPETRLYVTANGIRRLSPPRPLVITSPPEERKRRVTVRDHAAVLRAYDRHEAAMQRAVKRLAEKQQRVTLQRLERYRAKMAKPETRDVSGDDVFAVTYWSAITADELESTLAAAWDEGGAVIAAALGSDFADITDRVIREMRARLHVLAGQITETTFQAIAQGLLEEGVGQGEGIDKLADRITAVFTDLETWRAEAIARTETVGGFNAAGQVAAQESGQVTARVWMATADSRTRETHAELDGYETQAMDDPFPNGCMYPGDPGGDPAETVNCRCTLEYVLLDDTEGVSSLDAEASDEAA